MKIKKKYSHPKNYSVCRAGLEVYKTDEENFKPYISAGLNCYIVHRTYDGGHFWTIIEIDGKKYASDQTGSGSEFNTVWVHSTGRVKVTDGGSYNRMNGKNPDC